MNRERDFSRKAAIGALQYGKEGDYWLKKFSGDLQKTIFPYDYPKSKPHLDGEKKEVVKFEFNPPCVSQLLQLSKSQAHRLYIILATNLVLLLYKYTGNKDIIVGSPILKQEIEVDFINTALALRAQVDEDITFKELLLDRLRPTITEANQHQNYPIETLLFQLNMTIQQGDFPLFDVVILLENIHEKKYIQHTNPNIIFSFLLTEGSIEGMVEYNRLLYQRTSAEKLANHFKRLMEEVVFNIDIPISRVEILSAEEKRQLLVEFNNTRTRYPDGKTITGLFAEQAAQTPNHLALSYESEPITYRQLNEEASKLASYLRFLGVTREEPVALMAENSYRVIVAILGVLKAGGAYLPINNDYPDQRKKYIINDCGVKRILTNIEVGKPDPDITLIHLDDKVIYQYPSQSVAGPNIKLRADNLAYIMYTSGSTGVPKGVMVDHRSVVRLVKNTDYVEFEEGDSILLTGALEFDASTFEIWGALLNGLTLHLVSKETLLNLQQLKQALTKNGVTTMWMTAPLFNQVLDGDIEIFTGLKNLLVGGDVLSPPHIYRLKNHSPKINIINGYGPTENTTFSTTYRIHDQFLENIPIGKPISNSTVYILDREFRPVPPGTPGELFVGGDGVSRGYLNQPELTLEKFCRISPSHQWPMTNDRLYRTGDLARWLPDGNIEFLGRIDQQVKLRGYRIELGEIENRLRRIDFIKEAVLMDRKSKDGEKYLCAYVVTEREKKDTFDASELRKILSRQLPDYMVPAYFLPLEEIPLTSNGKVDWRILPEPETTSIGLSYTAPRNPVEKKFAEIWSEVLKIEKDKISIDSDFFELGGHSLKATILISKLHKAFNIKIPLAELFKTPTIRELAEYIKELTTHRFSSIQCAEKKEYYELSAAQKRLYILQQIELTGTSYNIPSALMVEGLLDREKLENTFRKLIDRHGSFKTSFEMINEKPVQKIHQYVDFKINYSRLTNNDKEEEIISNFEKTFNLAQAPLIRVELIRLPPGKEKQNPIYILMVDIHHIITDGTSMDLLVEEFKAYYAGEELSPLRLHYKDYAEWQNSKEQKEASKQQETYWRKQFAGEIPVLNIPVDYPRPAIQNFAGNMVSFQLDHHQTHALNTLVMEEGISLYILLLTITNVFLSKLSNQEDIVIGTPIAARRHADLEPIIGMFVNTLAMRNYPVGHKTFRDFLQEVKDRTLETFENQEYQFEDLVEKVMVNRDASRNPLFDFALSLPNMEAQTGDIPRVEIPQLNIRPYESESRISKFDMTLTCIEGRETLQWGVEYCTKLFKKETIQRFILYFNHLISDILENKNKPLKDITIIPPGERRSILEVFNNTGSLYPREKTLHRLFEEQVERTPDNIAVVGQCTKRTAHGAEEPHTPYAMHHAITYGELNKKSNQSADLLQAKGLRPDAVVGVMMERSLEMVIGIFGILKAGGAYLPIDPEYPEERINYMLTDSSANVLVTTDSLAEEGKKVRRFEGKKILLEEFFETPSSSSTLPSTHLDLPSAPATALSSSTSTLTLTSTYQVGSANLAYIIYTSGSTGKPKGVLVDQQSVINILFALHKQYPLREPDTFLLKTAFVFDVSVTELFGWYMEGGRLAILEKGAEKDPLKIINAIEYLKVTHINFVPSMFAVFVESLNGRNIDQLSSLKYIFLAGEALLAGLVEKFRRISTGIALENIYGPTEAAVYSSQYSLSDWRPGESIPIGKPLPNIRLYILDKDNHLQPIGIPGELGIGGVGVSRGYLNRPELTHEKFVGNPFVQGERLYLTGDWTRWFPDGNLEFLGRIDYQVKIRGFRVELEEIKNQLLKHPGIKETVVIAKDDGQGDTYLCAYMVMTSPDEMEMERTAELRKYLSQSLPHYMIPAYFMQMEKIPLTPSGKVDRKALPDPVITSSSKYAAPRDEIEKKMVEIWGEILGRNALHIGIDDHFFELGGHSLKATIMIAKIHKELNLRLPLAEVFKTPTIRALAEYIKAAFQDRYASIEPVEKKEYYTLSSAQKRLYILQQMNPDSNAYNMPKTIPLVEEPDLNQLEQTFIQLIHRHESLRTSFHMVQDEPVQKIHPIEEVEFRIQWCKSYTGQQWVQPFDLARPPLVRVIMMQHQDGTYLSLVDMHHIISDGISQEILQQDFIALYRGQGLTPLRLQYKEFAQWQNRHEQKQAIRQQESYWCERFEREIPVLNLPIDYPRPAIQGFAGDTINFEIGMMETRQLNQLGLENNATLFMVLLAVFNVLLSQLSTQEDIVIGSPVAGRRHTDLEKVIGMFVNTLALRNYPQKDKSFKEFLAEVKEGTVSAVENQEYPFEDLVEKVEVIRDASRNPLFDVMMVLQNVDMDINMDMDMNMDTMETTAIEPGSQNPDEPRQPMRPQESGYENMTAKFDLTLAFTGTSSKLLGSLNYCTHLFKQQTIQRFVEYFKRIVSQVCANDHAQFLLSDIDILSPQEKARLLVDFNQTAAAYPHNKGIHQLFEEKVHQEPDHIALVFEDKQLTYHQLNKKTNQLARVLRSKGIGNDSIVPLLVERSIPMIIGIFGILKAGGSYLPLEPQYPEKRLKYILVDSAAQLVLAQRSYMHLPPDGCETLDLDQNSLYAGNKDNPEHIDTPGDSIYTLYTSGSTGNPKGVLIRHSSVVNILSCLYKEYPFYKSDTYLFKTSYVFDVSVSEIFGWFLGGGRLAVLEPGTEKDPGKILEAIARQKVTHINFVPSMFNVFVDVLEEQSIEGLSGLRYIFLAGEALLPGVVNKFRKLGSTARTITLENIYGPTEAAIYTSRYSLSQWNGSGSISIGKPLQNLALYILNQQHQLQPVGVVGELCISGIGLARGYLNNPELTAEKFCLRQPGALFIKTAPGPYALGPRLYKTGDLAQWLPDGNIEFLGRIDHQVKIRGYRIELGEIENCLLKHSEIKEVVVSIQEDKNEDKYICAYIISETEFILSKLRDSLSKELPDYMIPSYFVPIEKIPLTPNGKIDRKALPKPELKGGESYAAPKNEIERKLVQLWSNVLDIEKDVISINSNFFQLGGHSLKAMILVSKMHKEFDVNVPLVEIFKTPRINALAQYLKGKSRDVYMSIEPEEKKEYYPLSSAQKRLYILQQIELASTAYNMPGFILLEKGTDLTKIEKTIKKLIKRHESLRTSFHMIGDEPMQRIHDELAFEVEEGEGTRGLAPLSIGERRQETEDRGQTTEDKPPTHLSSEFIRPFDLSKAPLLRVGLLRDGEGNRMLLVDMHHIISDGISHEILEMDFMRFYEGEELPRLRIQYKDFSQWQNSERERGKIKTQENYWLKLYASAKDIPRLNLPLDFKRPEVFTFAGDTYDFMLGREEALKFKALGSKNGATLYMNILAALNTLFYKYTSQADIIIGSGIAGRPHADLQDIIGMFVNTLAMRNYPNGEKSYENFLKEVKTGSINAFENQDAQFEGLVDKLDLTRDPSRNPLFDISMVVQNFRPQGMEDLLKYSPLPKKSSPLLRAESQEPGANLNSPPWPPETKNTNPTAKFDMTFFVNEAGEDIYIRIEYYTGIFKEETIKRLASHLRNVLKAVVRTPSIRLKDIDIVSKEEKQQLIHEFNDTGTDYPADKTIHELFAGQTGRTPDYLALHGCMDARIPRKGYITYRELNEKSSQISRYLCEAKGIQPEDRVGILLSPSLHRPIAMLGVLKAGAAYAPIDHSLPAERVKYIIDDASIGVVISEKKYVKDLNRLQWECDSFHSYLCPDSFDIHQEDETGSNELMDRELWHHVGETATDDITAGGWISSYTGNPFSKKEMDEYGDNILAKLQPLLNPKMRVLEIGCASGISMYRIAPRVGFYYGTDLSQVIIERNKKRVEKEGHRNIKLSCLPAHEINKIPGDERNFDLIIMNSVVQCFHGHNYLRKIIGKSIDLLADEGYLFLGDIMDLEKKESMIQELQDFKYSNRNKGFSTKTDFSSELFLSRGYWNDLGTEFEEIETLEAGNKIHTIENELTKFRYDVIVKINKKSVGKKKWQRQKHQDDFRFLSGFGSNPQELNLPSHSHSLAYLIYTSGTSGQSKGVMIEHGSLVNLCYWHNRYYRGTVRDHATLYAGFGFDASVWELFPYLIIGATLYIVPDSIRLDIEELYEYFQQHQITISFLPTQLCEQFLSIKAGNTSLRVMLTGGDKLHSFVNRDYALYNNYGPTENAVVTTSYLVEKYCDNIPIGKPIHNSSIYILDPESLQIQPVGVGGELCIGGVGLARGYLNNPELTARKFILTQASSSRPYEGRIYAPMSSKSPMSYIYIYKSGDLARWLSDGNIEFLGRIDQQVKIRGFRIELGEIENQLLELKEIQAAVIVDRLDESGQKYLCGYFVSEQTIAPLDLKEQLLNRLPEYMIPGYFMQIETIPLTPAGKVDRKALPSPEIQRFDKYTGPRDGTEKKLIEIWGEILGSQVVSASIGIDDNFFELGGHSLKATIMVSKIQKELNVRIPLVEIFKTPTIRELAQYMNRTRYDRYTAIEAVEKKDYYPLSSAQKRLYILRQMEPGSVVYNIPGFIPLEIAGDTHAKKFAETFRKLIRRHESLRTSFHMTADEPVQRVHDEVEFEIEYYDTPGDEVKVDDGDTERTRGLAPLSGEPTAHSPQPTAALISSFIRPFDLSRAPLLRVGLIQPPHTLSALRGRPSQEGNKYMSLLLVDMHHIISDGVSHSILVNDFMALFGNKPLPPLRIQYKDFSLWQNRERQLEKIKSQEKYWLKEFEGEIPVLELPTDYPRPAIQSFEGNSVSIDITREETKTLNKIALEEGATMFMVLLAMTNILISKLCGQEDIVIGSPIAGRRHADMEKIIGMFVNTLALRNYPQKDKSFKEFLAEVKEGTLAAFENQEYPFEDLVEKVELSRDVSRNPLFDVMMLLQNVDMGIDMDMDKMGTTVREPGPESLDEPPEPREPRGPIESGYENRTAKFDLTLAFTDSSNKLLGSLNYCTHLFKQQTIQRFVEYFKRIVSQVCDNHHTQLLLSDIDILSPQEKAQLLVDFNQTAAAYPHHKTIHQLFEEKVHQEPNHIALVFEDKQLTYHPLNKKANQLAYVLRDKGAQPDMIIGILVKRSIEMIASILAILKASGAYMPIAPDYPTERFDYMLADSGANMLLTTSTVAEEVKKLRSFELKKNFEIIFIDSIEFPVFSSSHLLNFSTSHPANLAYVIYTSGTTGKPKGTLIRHQNVVQLMFHHNYLFDFNSKDTWMLFHSYCFDFSVWEMYGALLYGGKLVLISALTARDPRQYLEILKKEQVTVLNQTPPAFYNLALQELESPQRNLQLKYIIFGGDVLKPAKLKQWKNKYPETKLINMFGITETTVHVTYKEIRHKEIELNASNIGKPIPTLSLYVMDKNLRLSPMGAAGELCVGGEGVARGYLNRPELTREKFVNIPCKPNLRVYRSGDSGRWLNNGDMEYLGRIDLQVKIRGFRVEPGEIENQLLNNEKVKEAVVIALDDKSGNKYLCAYIAASLELNVSELRENLSGGLPGYMIPSYFVMVEKIPLTPNGKIDRRALPEPAQKVGEDYTAPRDQIEEKLVKVWSEVLDRNPSHIGIDDHFFELGGHSLKATIMLSKIHKELNVRLPLAEVFKTPTIRALARYISEAARDRYVPIEPVEKKEYYALSSAQKRLYILQQMELESTAYNMPQVIPLPVESDIKRLEQTFNQLIQRHESLRTSFQMIDEVPGQRIHEPHELEFAISHYHIDDNQIEETIERFVRHFDLNRAPLLRVSIVKLAASAQILLIDMHHIITDGTSQEVLKKEFMTLYSGEELAPLRLHYTAFSEWQNGENQKELLKRQELYWLKVFSDNLPVLQLPIDYPRPLMQSFEGKSVNFILSEKETQTLKNMGKETGTTLYMGILSIYTILLSKLSGQEDIVVGSPTAARPHADLEHIIGMFVNTLALKNYPSSKKTFIEFLTEVKNSTLKAFENQDYQFEDLVEIITIPRDTSRNPLFDVMFNLLNQSDHPGDFPEIQEESLHQHIKGTSKFDMTLRVIDFNERLLFNIEYCTRLFKTATIDRIIGYFKNIITSVMENSDRKIKEIEIISPQKKQEILTQFNKELKYSLGFNTFQHKLFDSFREHQHQIAIEYGADQISYSLLDKRSTAISYWIIHHEIEKKSLIGVCLDDKLDIISIIVGILKARCVFVILDPLLPLKRIQRMIQLTTPKIIFTTKIHNEKLTGNGKDIVQNSALIDVDLDVSFYKYKECQAFPPVKYRRDYNGDDPIYIYFTSGTTGTPKAIAGKNSSLLHFINWEINTFNVTSKFRLSQFAGIGFDAFLRNVFTPLCAGGVVCIPKNRGLVMDSQGLIDWIDRNRIHLIHCVPALFRLFNPQSATTMAGHFRDLKYILLSGDIVNPYDLERWYAAFGERIQLVNCYGATETTLIRTYHPIRRNDIHRERVPIGKPLEGARAIILDENLNICDQGIVGEIYIRTSYSTHGYYNDPQLNDEKFIPNPFSNNASDRVYRTGDLGRLLEDGNMEFLGRKDDQVKIRGVRMELSEIQYHLLNHDQISNAIVVTNRVFERSTSTAVNLEGEGYLCAYFVSAKELSIPELRKYLSRELPDYMIPSYFMQIEKIPLTPNGKVDKKALPVPEIKAGADYAPPGNEIENKLVEIWSELLVIEKDNIGIDDNFFELGGHSLNATIMTTKIHKVLNVKVPLVEVFKTPRVRGLAEYIKRAEGDKYASIEPAEKKEYYVLSSAQKRLYILQQMELTGTAYNMPGVIPLEGDESNIMKLERTFKQLIHRHESFRTSFHMFKNEPVQRIHDQVKFEVEYYDQKEVKVQVEDKVEQERSSVLEGTRRLAPLSRGERRQRTDDRGQATEDKPATHPSSSDVIRHLSSEFIRPFDLSQAPLLRVGLIKTDLTKYLLMVDMHHIISDGISHMILERDFMNLYADKMLPTLRVQYKDFSQWQNKEKQKEYIKQQEKYWLRLFEGEIPELDLPTDYPRPTVQLFEGSILQDELSCDTNGLKALALENSATTFMVLLTFFYIFLSKISGKEDIIVGTPAAGRRHSDLEGIIGMFVNSIALRNRLTGEKTFTEFLKEVREKTLEAFDNQDYQLEELVKKIPVKRGRQNPLFDVMFTCYEGDINKSPGIEHEPEDNIPQTRQGEDPYVSEPQYQYERKTSKFDLRLHIMVEKKLSFFFEYSTKLFKKETIEMFAGGFKEIVLAVLPDKNIKLKDITVTSHLLDTELGGLQEELTGMEF